MLLIKGDLGLINNKNVMRKAIDYDNLLSQIFVGLTGQAKSLRKVLDIVRNQSPFFKPPLVKSFLTLLLKK